MPTDFLRLSRLLERLHASLTGVTSDQHHARSHDHSNALDGSPIAVAGLPNLTQNKIWAGDPTNRPAEEDAYAPESVLDIFDDFISGSLVSGGVGSLGWNYSADAVLTAQAANHPGIIYIRTTAVLNNRAYMYLLKSVSENILIYTDLYEVTFIVKIPTADAKVFIGVIDNISAAPGNQSRAGFEFDTGVPDTYWMMCAGDGAAPTRTATDIAPNSMVYYKLKVKKLTTNYEFYIADILKGTLTTNLPSANLNIGVSIETLEEDKNKLYVDFFRLKQAGITR